MAYTPEEQEAARQTVKSALWARFAVNHTKKTCALSILVPILAVAIIIVSGVFSLDDAAAEAFFVRNDIVTRLADARTAVRDQFPFESAGIEDGAPRSEPESFLDLTILFRGRVALDGDPALLNETQDDAFDVLTRENLALMKKAEDQLIAEMDYPTFCLLDRNTDCDGEPLNCALPQSITNHPILYGIETNGRLCGRRQTSEPVSQQQFDQFMQALIQDDPSGDGQRVDPEFSIYLSNDFSPSNPRSWVARSNLLMGFPFEGYTKDEDVRTQIDEFVDWSLGAASRVEELSSSQVDIYITGGQYNDGQFGDIALRDLSFSVAAVILVFVIICLHTGSILLAGSAMLQIFLAFPIAFTVYHFVFRQLYFSTLQILAIFLLLGIGADDVFVFTDAWKQAAVVLGPDCPLETRMSWTYRRSVKAMLVTSLTTSAAFFVTGTSPIFPISTLGIWVGLLVLLQFGLVITIYPCAVVMQHRFWRVRSWRTCLQEVDESPQVPFWQRCVPQKWRSKSSTKNEYRLLERFFRGRWLNFILKVRFFVVAVILGIVGVSIYLATLLEPPAENELFLPESHPIPIAFRLIRDAFPRSDSDFQLNVRMSWGFTDIDRSGTSRFDTDELGNAVLDSSFDLKPAASQQAILDACTRFGGNESLILQSATVDTVECWITDFRTWREENDMGDFEDYATDQALVDDLIAFGTQEVDGRQPNLRYLSDQHIGFTSDRSRVVFTELRFVSPAAAELPFKIMFPIYSDWLALLENFNAEAPDGVNKAVVTGGFSWNFMISQRTLVRSMFTGIGVMIAVAFVALTFSTLNWLVAALATLSIGGIVAMMLGLIQLLGWELGVTETIGIVVSIGFSFDGVAHIATAYVESKKRNKFDRTQDALTDLGISIFLGAITTLLAGLMLFPAIITFFVKFGGFVVSTISFSLMWALLIFPAVLLIIGPVEDFGSLSPIFRKINPFKRRQSETPMKVYYKTSDEELGDVSSAGPSNVEGVKPNVTQK